MRVFVTGATGFIGSAVVSELIAHGYDVLGLSRSDVGANALIAAGAKVHRGSLEDLESLKSGAAACDAVLHLAFIHDFTNFAASCATDQAVVETIGSVLEGTDRPFIVTSGLLGLPPNGTEDDVASDVVPRKSEAAALALVAKGVRAMVVRLPPSVHGDGDHGFVPMLIKTARDKGSSLYVGDGANRWPAVHRLDAARLYRLALEKGAAGDRFHGVADEGVPTKLIAETLGKHLGVPTVSKSAAEAAEMLGFVGVVLGMDVVVSTTLTQARLGWHPSEPGLIQDLEHGTYFNTK